MDEDRQKVFEFLCGQLGELFLGESFEVSIVNGDYVIEYLHSQGTFKNTGKRLKSLSIGVINRFITESDELINKAILKIIKEKFPNLEDEISPF